MATDVYGPLSLLQRVRVVTLLLGWLCGFIFLGVQVYLGLKNVLGLPIKTSYSIALVSFTTEILAMIFIGLMPALAGLDSVVLDMAHTPLDKAFVEIMEMDFPFVRMLDGSLQ